MSEDRLKTEVRKAQREREIGEDATCILCGETDVFALMNVKKAFIEDHHVVGKNHDDELTAPLCRNCHAKTHESYRQAEVGLEEKPTFPDRLVAMLRALGDFLSQIGGRLRDWAQQLQKFIEWLDSYKPDWRSAWGAA